MSLCPFFPTHFFHHFPELPSFIHSNLSWRRGAEHLISTLTWLHGSSWESSWRSDWGHSGRWNSTFLPGSNFPPAKEGLSGSRKVSRWRTRFKGTEAVKIATRVIVECTCGHQVRLHCRWKSVFRWVSVSERLHWGWLVLVSPHSFSKAPPIRCPVNQWTTELKASTLCYQKSAAFPGPWTAGWQSLGAAM
jgi:hypothetical protein